MKIKLLHDIFLAGKMFSRNADIQVLNEIGVRLIVEGHAMPYDSVAGDEAIGRKIKIEIDNELQAMELLKLPFKQLIKAIDNIQDREILKLLTTDKRKSIRELAINKINNLK